MFLEKGTPLFITSHNMISAKNLKTGQQICLYVEVPLATKENIIIPSGTPAYFKITKIKKPKMAGEPGQLEITPQYLKLASGSQVPLAATPFTINGENKEEKAHYTGVAAGSTSQVFYDNGEYNIGQGVEAFAPLAALLVKGGHATIPKGVQLQALVGTETPIKIR
ncbi:MAG: hypothetical protein R2788_19855 [Saprospiraceae bacterium]